MFPVRLDPSKLFWCEWVESSCQEESIFISRELYAVPLVVYRRRSKFSFKVFLGHADCCCFRVDSLIGIMSRASFNPLNDRLFLFFFLDSFCGLLNSLHHFLLCLFC